MTILNKSKFASIDLGKKKIYLYIVNVYLGFHKTNDLREEWWRSQKCHYICSVNTRQKNVLVTNTHFQTHRKHPRGKQHAVNQEKDCRGEVKNDIFLIEVVERLRNCRWNMAVGATNFFFITEVVDLSYETWTTSPEIFCHKKEYKTLPIIQPFHCSYIKDGRDTGD